MLSYPAEAVWQETAYLAYHLHWSMDDLLGLEHLDRVRMVRAVVNLEARSRQEARDAGT
ncbi:MAG TPA: DUF6760 family protein [Kineosporiaceae bacterium]|nr:DUF6760 family protein [Kineosporiaceae bacterium]